MHMLGRASLDERSLRFAERLFCSFSEWEQYAELLTDVQGLPTGAFRVSIPQPYGKHTLDVRTDEGEITVSSGGIKGPAAVFTVCVYVPTRCSPTAPPRTALTGSAPARA